MGNCSLFGLCLNSEKFKCTLLHRRSLVPTIPRDIMLNGERIEIVHAYITGHYKPSVRIIDLVSHNTFMVILFYYQSFC